VPIGPREDAVVADGHATDGRRQISAGVLATAHGLAVNDPVLSPDMRIHERKEVGLVPLRSELRSAEHRQGLNVDQDVLA
jgi:hypothetical protein